MTAVPGGAGMEAWSESDVRDVRAWLISEADQRVQFFPQRRDGVDALVRHLAENLPHLSADRDAEDGQANDCRHDSATGVDTAPIGPDKVWRCDHCGLTWTDQRDTPAVDTTKLSNESMEAIGTSIQNAAGGVDFPLPEYVAVAIAENLIASTWLTDRLRSADRDALAAEVEKQTARAERWHGRTKEALRLLDRSNALLNDALSESDEARAALAKANADYSVAAAEIARLTSNEAKANETIDAVVQRAYGDGWKDRDNEVSYDPSYSTRHASASES